MKPLIPIIGAIIRTRDRRECDRERLDGWCKTAYNENITLERNEMKYLIIWIDEFTKGRFFLSRELVAFEDEEDFVIFHLWYRRENV